MFSKFCRDDRGAIAVLTALSIVVVIGMASLAVEFGHGLLQRSDNQRVADLAAYGGVLDYNTVYDTLGIERHRDHQRLCRRHQYRRAQWLLGHRRHGHPGDRLVAEERRQQRAAGQGDDRSADVFGGVAGFRREPAG